jgi:hypothetical protein
MRFASIPVLALLVFCAGCKPDADVPSFHGGDADVSRYVVIGDNFLSGYQDGALRYDHELRSIGAMLGAQLEHAGGRTFVQNTVDSFSIGWHSKPWESWYVKASQLGNRTDCEGVTSLGPVKQFTSVTAAMFYLENRGPRPNYDFSIPFATTADFFQPSFGADPFTTNQNPFYHHIAANPGVSTVKQEVVASAPTFFSMWLGMENIFSFARRGGTGAPMISSAQFAAHLDSLLQPLTAAGAKGVIANLPDFRSFPYYTLIPWNGAELTQSKADSLNNIYIVSGLTHINFHAGDNGFVIDDPAAPFGVRQMHGGEYITLSVPLDSMKCNYMGILFQTIPDQYALDSAEVAEIDAAVAAYNAVISQKAAQYNLALVDANRFLKNVESGIKWDGVDFNATFVSGGFYSLDGYHPHEKGYALLTNEFIKAINTKFGAAIPTLNCFECTGVLFP